MYTCIHFMCVGLFMYVQISLSIVEMHGFTKELIVAD